MPNAPSAHHFIYQLWFKVFPPLRYAFRNTRDMTSRGFQRVFHFGIFWLLVIGNSGIESSYGQNTHLFETPSQQQVLGVQLSRELDFKRVFVPLGQPNAGVVIRCDAVRLVSKQIGMIKIGLLPALEVSGMNLEIRGEIPAAAWSGMVKTFFQNEHLLGQSKVQGFSLVFDRAKSFRLDAKRAFYDADSHSLQLEKTMLEIDGQRFPFRRAELPLEGERAGNLLIANTKSCWKDFNLPIEILPSDLHDKHYDHQ